MSDERLGVILEDIRDKLQSLAESVGVLAQDVTAMKLQVALIPDMSADIKAIKSLLRDHEGRMQELEMPQRA